MFFKTNKTERCMGNLRAHARAHTHTHTRTLCICYLMSHLVIFNGLLVALVEDLVFSYVGRMWTGVGCIFLVTSHIC